MMPNFKDRKPAIAGSRSFFPITLFLILVSAFAIFCVWYGTRLVVAVVPEGVRKPFCFGTYPGDAWNIRLTHSVEKTEWDEYFRVNAVDDMTMTHTRFESLGWGYPYSPADGKLSSTPDGKFIVEMNRPYRQINLRISEQAMQHLAHGAEDYDLIGLYGQGTAVTIKVQYRYQYLLENYF